MSKIREAVSAVFVFQDKIFMITRQPYLLAFPGYWAFPGGKVDQGESTEAFTLPFLESFRPVLIRSLVREVQEELNFDLEEAVRKGMVEEIFFLGHATTPEFHQFRFKTNFFKIVLNEMPSFIPDANEVAETFWWPVKDYLELYDKGKLLTVPPIVTLLRKMQNDHSHRQNFQILQKESFDIIYDPQTEVPFIEALKGIWQLPTLSHTLPPADRTNAFIIGDSSSGSFLIDPSPNTPEEFQRLCQVLEKFSLKAIFLTHHHPDHHQMAPLLARKYHLPLFLSKITQQLIIEKWGEEYLKDLKLHWVQEGDVLTTWLGKDVFVYEIPGHDEGQLGLAPRSMEWFIVGDLIQGVGTVVIAAPEGDMQKYYNTLQRIIELEPQVIFPSHGIALGGCYRLDETLKHRKMREEQVLEGKKKGMGQEEILKSVYPNLDPRLIPYALLNIESHLLKLKREGRI